MFPVDPAAQLAVSMDRMKEVVDALDVTAAAWIKQQEALGVPTQAALQMWGNACLNCGVSAVMAAMGFGLADVNRTKERIIHQIAAEWHQKKAGGM